MHPSLTEKGRYLRFAIVILVMTSAAGLLAQNNKKTSPPPPKPAAPAKATSSGPARPTGGSSSAASHPSTAVGARTSPTTADPGSHHVPTANKPLRYSTNGNRTQPTSPVTANRPSPVKVPATVGGSAANVSGKPAPSNQKIPLKNGSALQKRPNGTVSDVHDAKRGMNIHYGINGSKRVSVERPNHSRVAAERGRPGYVQRGYTHNGHDYARRTYYFDGRAYDRYYRGYPYRGVYMEVYAPARYYPVGFYGWAVSPWHQPVVYPWGWMGSPWYGYYGAYFTPYAMYPTASLWLTDYMISTDLGDAYQAQQEGETQGLDQQDTAGIAPLTPAVKQMIADEVKDQLVQERSEAQQNGQNQDPDPRGIAGLFSDGRVHVFVAGGSLDVVDAAGTGCAISDGDALELATPPPVSATSATLVVLSSKGGQECPKSDTVTIALTDLQDMQNHMRETIDQGLQELQSKQGSGGLPSTPPSAKGVSVDSGIAKDAPSPDPNGATAVNQQLVDADQAEKEVVAQAQQETAGTDSTLSPAATSAPPTIAFGQSIDEVTASLGAPVTVIDLGSKKIYKYKDMKITFNDGKVSNVE